MAEPLTDLEKIRRLPYQVIASFLNSVFCVLTFVGSVFVLFLSELGLDKARIGVLLSLIPFSQMIAPLVTPFAARMGYKRMFLTFFGLRKGVMAMLLLTPWMLNRYGLDAAYFWVLGVVILFGSCRALGESVHWPWLQEIIPNGIRGKFTAINTTISAIGFIGAVSVAGFVISHYQGQGLTRFIWLIGAGSLIGATSLFFYALMPGGRPGRDTLRAAAGFGPLRQVFQDRNYVRFLAGQGLASLGLGALLGFVPLYMKEIIGFSSGFVVWLDVAGFLGLITFSYLWGWASDRYGSKPVMLTSLCILVFLPPVWFLMPRGHALSGVYAMSAAFVAGAANVGWLVTYTRYLCVSAVPPDRKIVYMALFSASAGFSTGAGPLIAGRLIELSRGLAYDAYVFHFDCYTPLFAMGFTLLSAAIWTLSRLDADGAIPTQHFIGMFFQGNPVAAVANLMRYRWSGDELDRILIAERLGRSGTLLSAEELIDALHDPSYNVRHEAIHAVSNMRPHRQLVDALAVFLGDNKTDLSLSAAYALGKLQDKSAVAPLRKTLLSEYRLLRARSARSLAMLGDTESCAVIHRQLQSETDQALRIAYASSLGAMRYCAALDDIADMLRATTSLTLRAELALALARLVGDEQLFVRLWRRLRRDCTTSAAQIVLSLRREFPAGEVPHAAVKSAVSNCATAFGGAKLDQAIRSLCELCDLLPTELCEEPDRAVIALCRQSLGEFGPARIEYVSLLLHTVFVALRKWRKRQ